MRHDKILFIPGFQKAGTTQLFNTLVETGLFDGFRYKESYFFDLDEETIEKNFSWYLDNYKDDNRIKLDATTSYAYSRRAIENIKNVWEDPYFLFIKRDQAERSYSAYLHMVKKNCHDRRSFDNIVEALREAKPGKLYEYEEYLIQESRRKSEIDFNYHGFDYMRKVFNVDFDSIYEDPNWAYRYFSNSLYAVYIERYKVFLENV